MKKGAVPLAAILLVLLYAFVYKPGCKKEKYCGACQK